MELCDYSGAAEDLSNTADSLDPGLADKFTEMLEKAFEKYGDPAEEYMAGQIAALKAMLRDAHDA